MASPVPLNMVLWRNDCQLQSLKSFSEHENEITKPKKSCSVDISYNSERSFKYYYGVIEIKHLNIFQNIYIYQICLFKCLFYHKNTEILTRVYYGNQKE